MSLRVLKNITRTNLTTRFRTRNLSFPRKHSKIFDWDKEEDRAEYAFWLEIYGGLIIDISSIMIGGE